MPSGGLNRDNLIGQKFGGLTVIKPAGSTSRGLALWECLCECGSTFVTSGYYLRQGRKKSCGCRTNRKFGSENHRWSGFGSISGAYWHRIRQGAINRNLELAITIEEAWELFVQQNGKCALSGEPLVLCTSDSKRRKNSSRQTASLDRKDSTKGYTRENVQWIHKTLNKMKMEMPDDEFISWCLKVAKNENP